VEKDATLRQFAADYAAKNVQKLLAELLF